MTEMPGDTSAGRLYIEAASDTTGFGRELKRKIDAEVKGVKARIKAEIDTRGTRSQAQQAARDASAATKVRLKAELDKSGLIGQARAAAREASAAAVVRVKMELDTRGFKSKVIAEAKEAGKAASEVAKVKYTADTSKMATEVVAAAEAARLAAGGDVKIGADTSSAQREVAALGNVAGKTADEVAKIPRAFGGGSGGSGGFLRGIPFIGGIASSLAGVIGTGPAIVVVGAAVADLAAAAVQAASGLFAMASSIGQAAESLAILPNLIATAVQGIGALIIGFTGITAAVQALGKTDAAQAKASINAADERRAAQERVADAHRAVRDAVRGVGEAHRNVQDAIRGVAEAERGVADAQRNAVDAARAIEEAQRNVADAHQAVADSIRDLHRARIDVPEANRDAAENTRDAVEALSDSERNVTRAQQDSLDAQQALNDAREQARQRIHDLNWELAHSGNAEADAMLALRKAREDLQDVQWDATSSATERASAQQAVKDAQDNLARVRKQNRDLARETAEANKKGVKGSDEVQQARQRIKDTDEGLSDAIEAQRDAVEALSDARRQQRRTEVDGARQIADAEQAVADARDNVADAVRGVAEARRNYADAERGVEDARRGVADAERRVADARRGVKDAERAVARARRDLADATRDLNKPSTTLANALFAQEQAFKHLSPAGRRFARFLYGLRDRMYRFRNAVQQAILPPIQRGIKKAMPFLDTLQQGFVNAGKRVGRLAERVGKLFGSKGFNRDTADIMRSNNRALGRFSNAAFDLIGIFRDLMHEARPLVRRFSEWVEQLFKGWKHTIHVKRETGELRKWFKRAGDAASTLGDIIGNIIGILMGLGGAAAPSGKSLMDSFADTTERWEKWVKSKEGQKRVREFFNDAKDTLKELGKLIAGVSKFVGLFTEGEGGQATNDLLKAINGIIKGVNTLIGMPGVAKALFKSPISRIIDNIKRIPDALGAIWDAGTTVGQHIRNLFGKTIPDKVGGALDWINKNWVKDIPDSLSKPVKDGRDGVAKWWDRIKARFQKGRDDAKKWYDKGWRDNVPDWMEGPIQRAKDGIDEKWDRITTRFNNARDWVSTRFKRGWDKVETFMQDPVGNAKTGIGKALDNVKTGFERLRDNLANRWSNRWDSVEKWMEDPVANAKSGISDVLDDIHSAFDRAVTRIGNVWDKLRKAAAEPVNFVITDVYNQGIRGWVNRALGLFGLKDKELPPAKPVNWGAHKDGGVVRARQMSRQHVQAAKGAVLPGYSPGRDIHQFASPTGGRIDLSGGEAIMRPEFTRYVGKDTIDRWNALARRGGYALHQGMSYLGQHAKGGVVGAGRWLGRFAKGGVLNPTKRVYMDGEPLSKIHAAQIQLAERLSATPMRVMQGSWQPPTSYSGTSHAGSGVADTSPGTFRMQAWLRKVAVAAWARNIPGAHSAGSGAHVHGVSRLDPNARGNSQIAAWKAGGDGLGGSDYGPNPPVLPNLLDRLSAFGPLRLSGGKGGGTTLPPWMQKMGIHVGNLMSLFDSKPLFQRDEGGLWGSMLGNVGSFLLRSAKDWLMSKATGLFGLGGGGADYSGANSGPVSRFKDIAGQVLHQLGYGKGLIPAVLHRIAQESSGRVDAVNNWDSNAAAGTPSAGLMQLVAGTYNAYKPRGAKGPFRHGVSIDPYSNIFAGVNYAANDPYHGYDDRSLYSVLMQPGGYRNGGWMFPGQWGINETRTPEAVLDGDESHAFVALGKLAGQVMSNVRDIANDDALAALVDHLEVNVGDRRDLPEALARVDMKLRAIRRGGVHARRVA